MTRRATSGEPPPSTSRIESRAGLVEYSLADSLKLPRRELRTHCRHCHKRSVPKSAARVSVAQDPNALNSRHTGEPNVREDCIALRAIKAAQRVFHGAMTPGAAKAGRAVDEHG